MHEPSPIVCPYCHQRPPTSDDHIIPEFLGGRTAIRACKPCNDTFGRLFEGRLSHTLQPLLVLLRANGMPDLAGNPEAPLPKWKKAYRDPATGDHYDLDSRLNLTLTKPTVLKDLTGEVVHAVYRTQEEAEQFRRWARERGFEIREEERSLSLHEPVFRNIKLEIGADMRRLALKACIATVVHVGHQSAIGTPALERLRDSGGEIDVRFGGHLHFDILDAIRPPLGHLVYVEGSVDRRVYGYVQLFGSFQFYVELNLDYQGPRFAALMLVDVMNGTDSIQATETLALPPIPERISAEEMSYAQASVVERMNKEISRAFREPKLLLDGFPSPTGQEQFVHFPDMGSLEPDRSAVGDETRKLVAKLMAHVVGKTQRVVVNGKVWDGARARHRRFDVTAESTDRSRASFGADIANSEVRNTSVLETFRDKCLSCGIEKALLVSFHGFSAEVLEKARAIGVSCWTVRAVSESPIRLAGLQAKRKTNLTVSQVEIRTTAVVETAMSVKIKFLNHARPQMSLEEFGLYLTTEVFQDELGDLDGVQVRSATFAPNVPEHVVVLPDGTESPLLGVTVAYQFTVVSIEPPTQYWELTRDGSEYMGTLAVSSLGVYRGEPVTLEFFHRSTTVGLDESPEVASK